MSDIALPTLTTVDRLKTFLDIAGTDKSEDDRLQQLLVGIENAVETWCRRKFASLARTEYYSGSGRSELFLDHRPVTVVTSVHVDATGYFGLGTTPFASDTEWTSGTDFVPSRTDESEKNAGKLIALKGVDFGGGGIWTIGNGNIKVIYTAGYTTIPMDLELAIWQLASGVRKGAAKGGIVGRENIGRYGYSLLSQAGKNGEDPAIGTARSTLTSYRELM